MTNVDIANMALSLIGEAPTVTGLDLPASSPHAALCALWLPKAREQVLSMHAWSIADCRATLAHPRIAVSSVSAGGDSITTATAHNCDDNDVVRVIALTGATVLPAPLEEDTDYFVIDTGTTTLQLATEEDGDAIPITAGLTGSMVIERRSDRGDYTYAYAAPTDMLRPLRIVPRLTSDSSFPNSPPYFSTATMPLHAGDFYGFNPPTDWRGNADPLFRYELSRNRAGEQILYTNLEDADLCYIATSDDPAGWPPLLEQSVAWKLACFLAGAIKRDPATAKWCEDNFRRTVGEAMAQDARSSHVPIQPSYPWNR